jgi:chromosome segregation ATPase
MPDPDVVAEISKRLDAIIQGLGELKADLRDLRHEMQAGDAALRQEIGALRQEVQAGDTVVRQEIQALRQEMQAGDAALRQEIAAVRQEMQNYFRWTITTMLALFAVAVPIWIAVIAFVLQRLLG